MILKEEFVDIVDESGIPTGKKCAKSKAHQKGYLHPTVHVWIFRTDRQLLIQQRAFNKDTFPGMWDVSVAGHISAGETPLVSALREIEEEIGLKVHEKELTYIGFKIGYHKHSDKLTDNELHHIYLLKKDVTLSNLKIQKEEVSAIKFIDLNLFEKELNDGKKQYVPHGKEYYQFILKSIANLLKS